MTVRSRAPLRLGLAGGGTDVSPYCDLYGGFVMNAAIDKYAYAMIDPSPTGVAVFESLDHACQWSLSDMPIDQVNGSLRLLVGAYQRINTDFLDGKRPAVRIRTYSDAPPGSGLGSSSTMVVAIVTALTEYFSLPLGEYEIAHLAYQIEREDLALAGGKQDQYAAAFGGFNFMEFHSQDRVIVNPLRIKDWMLAELEASLLLYFTGVSRESAKIIDEQVRNTTVGAQKSVDAMHELKQEAVQMKEALLKGDLSAFSRIFQRGWEAKKRMASSVSNPMIDALERVAVAHGARATKVSGAGGGGFMMFVCDPSDRVRLSNALKAQGGSLLDFHFNPQGAVAWRAGR
jgi:D-glycero-alpha-D-manno-heptose-7-phosphate kinase